ncbi:MAG: GIY-YIG nuclease family protein [Patescibacteria group bacterium]
MKYFVYILKSFKNNDIYIGSTNNVEKRFKLHNLGKVKSTKSYIPWKLLEYHQYNSRSEAMKQEKYLKTGQQKEIIKRKYIDKNEILFLVGWPSG